MKARSPKSNGFFITSILRGDFLGVNFNTTINFCRVVVNPADQQGTLRQKNISQQFRCRQH